MTSQAPDSKQECNLCSSGTADGISCLLIWALTYDVMSRTINPSQRMKHVYLVSEWDCTATVKKKKQFDKDRI